MVPDVQQFLGAEAPAERQRLANVRTIMVITHLHRQIAVRVRAVEVPAPAANLTERVEDEYLVLGTVRRERGELGEPFNREVRAQRRRLDDGSVRHSREDLPVLVVDHRRVVA